MSAPPPGEAWDCHAHVFGDSRRFPLAAGRDYDPPAAPLEDYLAVLDRYGLARGVLVQPSVYGFDNRCLLDALERAAGRLLGIAVPAPETTPQELEALHRRGIRGVRCNLLNANGLPIEAVLAWQPVMEALGWHVQLHANLGDVAALPAYLARFTVPVVVDHMGRLPVGGGAPASRAHPLIRLVERRACFVKLSAPYRLTPAPPPWQPVMPLARALLHANPAACLWGTDWPHPDTGAPVRTADLWQALDSWCPDAQVREAVTVKAPRALFGAD